MGKVLAALIFFGLVVYGVARLPSTTSPTSAQTPAPRESASAIIARAEYLLQEWEDFGAKKSSLPPNQIRTQHAIDRLGLIGEVEPEHGAASATIQKIRAKQQQLAKAAEHAEKTERTKAAIDARRNYARELEHRYLTEGKDFTIRTEGQDATTLRIQWVLIGRPFVYNAINDQGVMATWRGLGFKTVVFADGYTNTWRQKVE